MDNLRKGDFNHKEDESEEQVFPDVENLPTLPADIKRRAIDVLNQEPVSPLGPKLPKDASDEEIVSFYRKHFLELQTFTSVPEKEWAPTGNDKKDREIIFKRFKLD